MNHGWFDDLTVADVQALFDALDADESGTLDFKEVRLLLKEVMDPPCADDAVDLLWQFTDMNEDGQITREELHTALVSGPIKQHIRHVQDEFKIREKFARSQGMQAHVDRDLLRAVVAARVDNDDAFATLPVSMVFILVFIGVVTTHLHVYERQRVESGMRDWITGFGANFPGPYLMGHVGNVDQMWQWAHTSGIDSLFSGCGTHATEGWPECRMAERHVLLTDVQVRQRGLDEPEEGGRSSWLVSSPLGQAHLAGNPGDYAGAARAQFSDIWTSWKDRHAYVVELRFVTYVESDMMFTNNKIVATFDQFGRPLTRCVSAALVIHPYGEKWLFGLDAFYIALMLYGTVFELKDMVTQFYHMGMLEGAWEYFNAWNAIDWVGTWMGFLNLLLWGLCVQAMAAESMQGLLTYTPDGVQLTHGPMQLGIDNLEMLAGDLESLRSLFNTLHLVMGLNILTVVLRFFKAFSANPRLQIVTSTMVSASTDILHFAIVFFSVFIAFALLGHIYFGGDLVQFASLGRSINTAFALLFGEFDWYIIAWDSYTGLPSGMSRVVLMMWYWFFMISVLLVLLNMLLAIIMEHYAVLVEDLRGSEDAVTVWRQADKYMKQKKETKDFITLTSILLQLDRDEDPAHPAKKVSSKSLQESFPGMSPKQAEWMMRWLGKAAAEQFTDHRDPQDVALLKEINSMVEKVGDNMLSSHDSMKKFNEDLADTKLRSYLNEEDGLDLKDPKEVAAQLHVQNEAISSLSRVVASLTTRMDQVDPRSEAVSPELMQMMKDVASVKSRLGLSVGVE